MNDRLSTLESQRSIFDFRCRLLRCASITPLTLSLLSSSCVWRAWHLSACAHRRFLAKGEQATFDQQTGAINRKLGRAARALQQDETLTNHQTQEWREQYDKCLSERLDGTLSKIALYGFLADVSPCQRSLG